MIAKGKWTLGESLYNRKAGSSGELGVCLLIRLAAGTAFRKQSHEQKRNGDESVPPELVGSGTAYKPQMLVNS